VTYSNGANSSPAVNADGSAIAYVSAANNLTLTPLQGQEVPVDTNLVNDVYVYLNDQVALATFNYATWQSANGPSEDPDITANARYVVFASKATNLVANDSNGSVEDIFRFDTQDGSIALVSLKTNGAAANGHSLAPSISDDGRFVAFVSDSTNLVSGDTNAKRDVFLRDMSTGTTTRLSVSSNGSQATGESNEPVISADGKVVAFHSLATNLIGSDKNKVADVFTRTIATNTTQRVSVTSTGGEGNARSAEATISSDGRYVAFQSSASNLVSGDTNGFLDVFVRDRTGNTTSRMSIPPSGSLTNGASYAPTISADGRFVAFATEARYDMSDTNGVSDVFEYDRTTGRLARRTSPSSDDPSTSPWLNGASTEPAISDNGISLAFVSTATNVISPPKPSATPDIHVHKWKNKRTRCLMFLISLTLAAEISLSRWADLDQDNRCDETAAMGPGDLTADPAATHSTPPLGPDIFQDNEERHSRLRFGTGTWGYNKIRPQHGWDVAVRNQVQMVLLAPSHTDEQGYTQVYYGTYFSSTWSTTCTRKVVIDYGPKPQIGKEPYYIINTYSRIGAWPDGGF
jgi:Tol biopolymer transport system component